MIFFEWAPEPVVAAEEMDATAKYFENLHPPLEASREIAIADVAQHFASESGPDGGAWAPWSESYALQRGPGSILVLSGEMKGASLSREAWPVSNNALAFDGAGVPERWIWHQEGATRRTRNAGIFEHMRNAGMELTDTAGVNSLPARPFIGLDEAAKVTVTEVFQAWVDGGISFFTHTSGRVQPRTRLGQFTGFGGV